MIRRRFPLAAVLLLSLCLLKCTKCSESSPSPTRSSPTVRELVVFYFPLDAETYNPVTAGNIEVRGLRCVLGTEAWVEAQAILARAPRVDGANVVARRTVRMKLPWAGRDTKDAWTLVAKSGDILFPDGYARLSMEQLIELRNLVEPACPWDEWERRLIGN